MTSSVDSSFNVADLGDRMHLDRDSELVDEDGAAVTLQQWVSRREAQRYDALDAESTDQSKGAASREAGSADGRSTAAESHSTNQSGQLDIAPDEGSTSDSEGQTGGTASVDSGGLFDPRERISGDPILTTETTVACSGLADGQPVACRVVLGASELVLARADDTMGEEYTAIPVDSIVDLSPDQIPSEFAETFESTVAIASDEGEGRQLAIIELRGNKQIGFANELFKLILQGCEIIVTHPAKKGGRVLETDPVPGELTVDDRSVSITAADGDDELTIRLSDIIHIGTGKQTYENLRMRGLSIRHLHASKEAAETAIKLRDDRKQKLFERFVRQSYRKRKRKIEQLTITEAFKEVLVALYSASDEMDLSMIIDKNPGELQDVFDSLQDVGLVRMTDDGTVLTGLGRVVVNEKIQDVNT
ncbi:helix-turn-helix protein [Halohasta litchfieldiae]|uniref:HTH domain-containing protein n=1 Tax=Halohasta litchfieldiae TaxID=1073996 RepID=A0A1H6SRG2_9EURY|nr:CheF family chemotaxis protein [Halohasta litchfieldiae]ATW89922.1 helix-turn-helix protein [Halohasta litchfieldiae]SEI66650.1 HTH domain-containing protein [Halohasta litchfieldiae]